MASRVSSRTFLFAATAAGILLPSGASAQSAAASAGASLTWSKSNAILGAPSALEAILNSQGASPAPSRAVQPASYSIPRAVPVVVQDAAPVAEGVFSGRPDIFGSVALRVGHTPLDARWRRVEQSPVRGLAAQYAQSLSGLSARERLEAVNRYVNRRVHFADDQRQFGRADVWAMANETLQRGRGDCEDYAIAKLQMLRRAGVARGDLYLVIVKDLVRRADHAVLLVRAAGHMYVLDNGTDGITDSEAIADYRPVLTFAATGAWTHGYRVKSARMTIASADIDEAKPVVPGAGNQRSRSASLLALSTGFSK
jgi:predicted transglutaminase-like cysteine proteinase